MVYHWNCASSLCQNSWRTEGVHYYTLPTDVDLQREYSRLLKNDNIKWKKQVICSAHWKDGKRLSKYDLPTIPCPDSQLHKLKTLSKKNNRNKELKKKIYCATRENNSTNTRKRKAPVDRSIPRTSTKPKRRKTRHQLENELSKVKQKCEVLNADNEKLSSDIDQLNKDMTSLQIKLQSERCLFEEKLKLMNLDLKKRKFNYECLAVREKELFNMCGLSVNEFDCLYSCLEPFTHLIIYPDCGQKSNIDVKHRLLDKKTELLVTLTIARHNVDLVIMGKLVGGSASTISRVFVAWMLLIRCVFDNIDMKPFPGFIEAFLPKCFVDAGFSDVGILGDNTETWIAQFEHFEINNFTFSHYKNHTTGKVSLWIFPHGALCKCSDAYPGSISDEQLTDQMGVLEYCPKGKVVLTDKGFAIADLCHERGLQHNRPPMKFQQQYNETDISLNFDIATLRIYNENAIGRIRDWSILNACWPAGRVDLLGTCWIALSHIVNALKKPVGPSE